MLEFDGASLPVLLIEMCSKGESKTDPIPQTDDMAEMAISGRELP